LMCPYWSHAYCIDQCQDDQQTTDGQLMLMTLVESKCANLPRALTDVVELS
jgi:hypothetical protein